MTWAITLFTVRSMVHPTQQSPSFGPRRQPASITITSNGRPRTLRIRPGAAAAVVGASVVFVCTFIAAAGYLVYRDDLLGATMARQVRMQYAYEDRLAALRSEIDRVKTRNLAQSQSVEEQLRLLLDRQAELGERHASLVLLVEKAREAGIDVPALANDARRAQMETRSANAGERRRDDALAYSPRSRSDDIITGALIRSSEASDERRPSGKAARVVESVDRSLDSLEEAQSAALTGLTAASEAHLGKTSEALAPLAIETAPEPVREPQGGPFIPAAPLHFVEQTAALSRKLDGIVALRDRARRLPLGRPVAGGAISSRFGYRTDPFLRRPALHSGLDLVAPSGAAVHAAGPGVVVTAGWSGAYGQLIEIRHAGGVTTRYGHLSAVLVAEGARVEAGALIGRVGSTGRSTGPHLHYETRRDGKPLDPAVFLAAGRKLGRAN